MANLEKAKGFGRYRNWQQTLHYAELAATKLKQIKDRPLEDLSEALNLKFNGLNLMDHNREALECAKEWYCLHLTKHTHPPAIKAGFALIESCIHNGEFFDAVLYARTTWETITLSRDSHIPDRQRELFTAQGAHLLAKAIHGLALNGGISAEEKKETGFEAIMLARKALTIHTQLFGPESDYVAHDLYVLAQLLDYFNVVDDDEVPLLYEQAKAIYARAQGNLSPNVASCENNLAVWYQTKAKKAHDANDLDRHVANLELALPRYREAVRVFRAANHVERADDAARDATDVEEDLRRCAVSRAAREG